MAWNTLDWRSRRSWNPFFGFWLTFCPDDDRAQLAFALAQPVLCETGLGGAFKWHRFF
jgi:hypothetical protein